MVLRSLFVGVLGLPWCLSGCGLETDAGATEADDGSGGGEVAAVTAGPGGGLPQPRPVFDACDGFATEVVSVDYGPGAGFGQSEMPQVVLGPPQGAGATAGSLDVVSLGNGGSIVLAFGAQTITDGPGADFIVFENAFWAGGDPEVPFAEPATVAVSEDGETWVELPCTAVEAPFEGCAGWSPVYANALDNEIDPHDPAAAGGEAFDLASVGLTRARFVKLTDRADLDGFSGSFDLDAVALVSFDCATR